METAAGRTLLEPFPSLSCERNRSCPNLVRSSQTRPILILVFLTLLLKVCCASSSSLHSLYYSYTFVSKPSQGLPQFSIQESMDGQPIAHYDSHTKEYRSLVPWMEQVKKEEPLWKEYTGIVKKAEQDFGRNLVTLKKYYNHSEGFHTLQWRYGCELSNDWLRRGSDQDSYDGMTFISFDKETLSWTASDAAAQLSKRKLEGNPSVAKHIKYYLEETCIEMLRRRITYGKEALLRKEPIVTVTSKAGIFQTETHICRIDGFFPKDIKATWRKDGAIWLQDTLHGLIAPNSDGTYHFWLSIRINLRERNLFQCHVEHDSLKSPLTVVLKAPAPHPVSIISTVLVAIFIATAIAWNLYLVADLLHSLYTQKYSDKKPLRRARAKKAFAIICVIFNCFLFLTIGMLLHLFASTELYRLFFIVLGSVCVLEVTGLFALRMLKKRKKWPFSSKQEVSESSNSDRSNHNEIPLVPIGVVNNSAGKEN